MADQDLPACCVTKLASTTLALCLLQSRDRAGSHRLHPRRLLLLSEARRTDCLSLRTCHPQPPRISIYQHLIVSVCPPATATEARTVHSAPLDPLWIAMRQGAVCLKHSIVLRLRRRTCRSPHNPTCRLPAAVRDHRQCLPRKTWRPLLLIVRVHPAVALALFAACQLGFSVVPHHPKQVVSFRCLPDRVSVPSIRTLLP